MFRMFSRFLVSLLALAFLACSEDSATGPEEDNPPSMPAAQELQLEAPDNAPGEVQGLVAMANGWVNLGYIYASHTNNGGELIDGVWTWTATSNNVTITITAEPNDDDTVTWTYMLDGVDLDNSIVYDNWVFMTGTFAVDGSSGSWQLYDLDASITHETEWGEDNSGTTTVTMTSYDSASQPQSRFITSVSPGQSGSIEQYNFVDGSFVLAFSADWTADGGSYQYYDENGDPLGEPVTWP